MAKAPWAPAPRPSLLANVLLSLTVTALFLPAAEGIAPVAERPRVPLSPEGRTPDGARERVGDFHVIESDAADQVTPAS
jgi:hypothetical protein